VTGVAFAKCSNITTTTPFPQCISINACPARLKDNAVLTDNCLHCNCIECLCLPSCSNVPSYEPESESESESQRIITTSESSPEVIKLMSLNCQSLHNKAIEFQTLIETHKPDIITGTESWLTNGVPDSLYFPNTYEVFRRDRTGRGGGVFICIHRRLNATLSFVSQTSEIIWCDVVLDNKKTLKLAVVYKPDQILQPIDELIDKIESFELERSVSQFVAICGDLNMKDANWDNPDYNSQCAKGLRVKKLFQLGFHQIVHEATRVTAHCANTLDVVLTNQPQNFQDLSVEDGIGDHKVIVAEITVRHTLQKRPPRKVFLYQKANIETLKTDLRNSFNKFTLTANIANNIDDLFETFQQITDSAVSNSIPTKFLKNSTDPPWYNRKIKNLIEKTRKQHSLYKKTMHKNHYEAYSNSRRLLNQAKKDSENTFLSTSLGVMLRESQKRFWSYVKFKTKGQHCSVPTLKTPDGTLLTEPKEKADLINNYFQSVFTREVPSDYPVFPSKTDKLFSLADITLTRVGIVKLIQNLNQYKACGPDEISPKLLKLAPEEFSDFLLVLYNKCFELKNIPTVWKSANVTPVFKKGNRSFPENYRPISLTSVLCKMFEHIVTSNLATFLEANNLFCNDQFGFRKNRSCEFQLHRVCQDLAFILDNKEEADLVFLDFSKAFDKVSHPLLLHKLKAYGLQIDIVSLIKSFLANRTQRVVVDGWSSEPVDVTSGVPQGSVLGPLLFLIYINDLPDKIKSKCRLFADDSLLYRKIMSPDDCLQLQKDLEEVADWCNKWLMTLNLDKCEFMKVTSKRNALESHYRILDHDLSQVSSYKYLGVIINEKLNWNTHINTVINKANKVLYVTKQALSKSSQIVKETAYTSIVRPTLEYSSSVWDPYHIGQIHAIEMVQRKAARFCLNRYQRMDSVSAMLDELKWNSLASRRRACRLSTFSKVFNNQSGLEDLSSHLIRAPQDLRYSHEFRVNSLTCSQNYGHYSFIPRCIRDWNAFPAKVLNQTTVTDSSRFRSLMLKEL
jgi:hypothetical protein